MAIKNTLPSLAGAEWLSDSRLQEVMAALTAAGGEVRVAGGAVRNALLGEPMADIDLATNLLASDVMIIAKAAGFSVHPTGLDHGTVSIVHQAAVFETTTLRRDVETDGRRAVVSFGHDWQDDALRRDFTMNALYCDATGKIYDFTRGYADIVKRRVKFVGSPARRIAEDYLRILRFFRFHGRYGKGAVNAAGLKACVRLKSGIKKLSAERIRQEMMKLLVAPRAVAVLKVMAQSGILKNILPHTDDWRVIGRLPADPVLRLFALSQKPQLLKEAWRLSNAESGRMEALLAAPDLSLRLSLPERRRILYHLGPGAWCDVVTLALAKSRAKLDDVQWRTLMALPENWQIPVMPLRGLDLREAGFASGPELGRVLNATEDWWIAKDFAAGKQELLAYALKMRNVNE